MRSTKILLICAAIFNLVSTTSWASGSIDETDTTKEKHPTILSSAYGTNGDETSAQSTKVPQTGYTSMFMGALLSPVKNAVDMANRFVQLSIEHPKLAAVTALLLAGQIVSVEAILCHCYCRTHLVTCSLDVYLGTVPSLSNWSGQLNCVSACSKHHGMAVGCYPNVVPESYWLSYGLIRNCTKPD